MKRDGSNPTTQVTSENPKSEARNPKQIQKQGKRKIHRSRSSVLSSSLLPLRIPHHRGRRDSTPLRLCDSAQIFSSREVLSHNRPRAGRTMPGGAPEAMPGGHDPPAQET